MLKVLNFAAAALFVVGFIPYILAIFRGETKPAKVSWILWATTDSITLAAMFARHALSGQIIGAVVGSWVVTVLAMKYGTSGWTIKDALCLAGGALGIILWVTLSNPTLALLVSCFVMLFASLPTFQNAVKHPEQEDKLTWMIFWLSCVAAILAVPKWNFDNAAQPISFALVETTMVYLLWLRPRPVVAE